MPDEAIDIRTEPDIRIRTRCHRQGGLRSLDSQVEAGDAAVQRRALHQVEPRTAALVVVLDGE